MSLDHRVNYISMCQAYGFLVLLLSSPSRPGRRGRLLGRRLALVEEEVTEELVVARPEDVELLLHNGVAVLVQEAVNL